MTAHPDAASPHLPTVSRIADVRAAVAHARAEGHSIGFVPTMGALHAGHTSLINASVADGLFTVVSIYVNPTQFGPNEDLAAYPRTLNADLSASAAAGAKLVFIPNDAEMYPTDDQTRVRPGPLADVMCGPIRPGHFEGVCTVVAKLFNIVQPDRAYFGQKDAQQALIIQKMVADLHIPVRIVVCPIVREPDGLAMSSRNAYLSASERGQALCLYRGLMQGRERLLAGEKNRGAIETSMHEEVHRVARENGGDVSIDYMVVMNADTLQPVDHPHGRLLLAGAVRIGRTRLIDNLIVEC